MTDTITLEQRLAALEKEVADLKRQVAAASANGNWLDKVIGSISDHEAFQEAMAYGREFRYSDRPRDEQSDKP